MNTRRLWGEIEERHGNTYVPDVSADIEKSMSKFCLSEYDLKQENYEDETEHLVLDPMDPLILHSISLQKYANEMTDMIRMVELAIDSNVIPPIVAAPPIPEKPPNFQKKFDFPNNEYKLTEVEEVKFPEISNTVAKQILKKCAATMLAHIGYETTHNSILILLTDVLEAFLKKVCLHLKTASEEELSEGLGGFPSFPEKVLTELGLGGIKGLHDYHQNRVVKYINILHRRCRELKDQYEKLLILKTPPPTDKVIRIGEEDVFEVQMHFPGMDGEMGLSLETGFQLLNSLEAEANLWEAEDPNTETSPGVSGEGEILKKKRTK